MVVQSFLSLLDLVFWGGLMVYAHLVVVLGWLVVAFAHLGVAGDGLHFHMFCHSKYLKMFSIKYFTFEIILY